MGTGLTSLRRASEELEAFLAAFGTDTANLVDRSLLIPHKDAGVTPAAVAAPTVVQSKMVWSTPTPIAVKPVMTTVEGQATPSVNQATPSGNQATPKGNQARPSGNQATAKLELLCSIPLSKLPGLSFKPAAVPVVEARAKKTLTEVGVDAVARTVFCHYHNKFGAAAWSCGRTKGKRCDWVQMTEAKPSIGWSERDRSRSHKRTKSRGLSNSRDHSRSCKRTKSRDRSRSWDRSRSRISSRSLRRKIQEHVRSRGPQQATGTHPRVPSPPKTAR